MKIFQIGRIVDDIDLPYIVSLLGITIILLWIGLFKFTPTESLAIKVYVENSPLMGWMYQVFSIQTTSDIIGTTEIAAALGLITGIFLPRVGFFASLLTIVIFFTTSTFLFSTPGILAKADWMWHPSAKGAFVIKDVSILGASLFLLVHYYKKVVLNNIKRK